MGVSWEEFKKQKRKEYGLKIEPIEPETPRARYDEPPAPRVARFNLVAVFGGQRKIVGFNLTRADADILEVVARKKLAKLPEPDAGGSPLFELTELVAERV